MNKLCLLFCTVPLALVEISYLCSGKSEWWSGTSRCRVPADAISIL